MSQMLLVWSAVGLNAVAAVADFFLDLIFGFKIQSGRRADRRRAASQYERSAQLVTVLHGGNYYPFNTRSLWRYFYVHNDYVHPNIVRRKNICLWFLEKDFAVFAVCDESDDYFDTARFPFLFHSLEALTRQLIILPRESFHLLARDIGEPTGKVLIVQMTTRCGSTLIAQIMSQVPNGRSLSEPIAFNDICIMFRKGVISSIAFRLLLQRHDTMNIFCKQDDDEEIDLFSLKLSPFSGPAVKTLKELFPESRVVFSTRHPKPSLLSLLKVFESVQVSIMGKLGFNFRHLQEAFAYQLIKPRACETRLRSRISSLYENIHREETCALLYILNHVSHTRDRDVYDLVVLYEDLVRDREAVTKALLRLVGMEQHLDAALGAFEVDSQKDTLAKSGRWVGESALSLKNWMVVDDLFAEVGVPLSCNMSEGDFRQFIKDGKLIMD